MLSKLLKYEIKATARIFLPLYVVLLVFAAVHRVIAALSPDTIKAPEVISMIVYIMLIVAVFVVTFVVIVQRFYKNLLSDEGYLMFTLPAEPWKHIVGKLLIAMMWSVVSAIAAFISVLIIAGSKGFFVDAIEACRQAFMEMNNQLGPSAPLVILELLLAGIISMAGSVLIIYAAIALGQLFNKHRVLASLGAFIALNTVTQIIFTIPAAILARLDIYIPLTDRSGNIGATFHLFVWLGIIFFGLISAGYFAITNYILNRHLNLE